MKRILTIVLSFMIVFSTVFCAMATESDKMGNVDGDSSVSITDASYIQFYLADLVSESDINLKYADVDGDKNVSVLDATLIQLYLAQIIDKFPADEMEKDPSIDSDGYYDQIVKP